MASHPAIRLVVSSAKSAVGYVHLQCHVKPGASKQREGVVSVSESIIQVCVSAQPKDNEANKAVRELFSDVFKCPKSDVEIIRGLKSREKTVAIGGIDIKEAEDACISRIRDQLESAIG